MSEQYANLHGNAVQEISPFSQVQKLEAKYIFKDKEEVSDFITTNPHLEPLLIDALNPIMTIFPDSPLNLSVFHDPESPTGDHLVLGISTKMRAREALKELDKIDESWWGENIERAKGMLSIELEYK